MAGEGLLGETSVACKNHKRLRGPVGKSIGFGGTRFLHEDCGQPFYLLRFGCPLQAKMLQSLFVVLGFQSVAQFHGRFLGARSVAFRCGSRQRQRKKIRSPLLDFEHVTFLVNGLSEFIRVANLTCTGFPHIEQLGQTKFFRYRSWLASVAPRVHSVGMRRPTATRTIKS
jgi:hypothetical protein